MRFYTPLADYLTENPIPINSGSDSYAIHIGVVSALRQYSVEETKALAKSSAMVIDMMKHDAKGQRLGRKLRRFSSTVYIDSVIKIYTFIQSEIMTGNDSMLFETIRKVTEGVDIVDSKGEEE